MYPRRVVGYEPEAATSMFRGAHPLLLLSHPRVTRKSRLGGATRVRVRNGLIATAICGKPSFRFVPLHVNVATLPFRADRSCLGGLADFYFE